MCIHNCKYQHTSIKLLHLRFCKHKENEGNYCNIGLCPIIDDVLKESRRNNTVNKKK